MYIAGFLDRLDGGLPQWNPGGVVLTRVDATHWTITFTGTEATQIEYKYALGSWDYVEKDAACGEVANRQLTLSLRHDRHADRQRHRPQLAQRGSLRELTSCNAGRAAGNRPPAPRSTPGSCRHAHLRVLATLGPNAGSGRLGSALRGGANPGGGRGPTLLRRR